MATAIVNRRVIVGWRTESINQVLDMCADLPWGMYLLVEVDVRLKPDSLGRLQRKYNSMSEKKRQFRLGSRDKYLASKQRERDKMLADYEEYSAQYMQTFPESQPVSYRVFAKLGLAPKWREDPQKAVLSSYRIPSEIGKPKKEGVKPPMKIV